MQKTLLWLIAISQFVLALFTLFLPVTFFTLMGLTPPAADNGYMIGMLGARFLAYGIGMAMLARASHPDRFWIANMLLIQVVDFALGAVYAGRGITPIAVVAFPMVNAAIFSLGLMWVLRRDQPKAGTIAA